MVKQFEMADADWPLTCSCSVKPVPSPIQTVAEFQSYSEIINGNFLDFLCNSDKWMVIFKSRVFSDHVHTNSSPETDR